MPAIQPTRFALRYKPIPTLALEYKRSQFSKPQVLVLFVPEIQKQKPSDLLDQLKQKHAELSSELVNQDQIMRLLEQLAQQVRLEEEEKEERTTEVKVQSPPSGASVPVGETLSSVAQENVQMKDEIILSEDEMEYFSDDASDDSF